jgi:hypothetical protein
MMKVSVVVGVMALRNAHLDFLAEEGLVGESEGSEEEVEGGEGRDMVCRALRRRRVIPEERKKYMNCDHNVSS